MNHLLTLDNFFNIVKISWDKLLNKSESRLKRKMNIIKKTNFLPTGSWKTFAFQETFPKMDLLTPFWSGWPLLTLNKSKAFSQEVLKLDLFAYWFVKFRFWSGFFQLLLSEQTNWSWPQFILTFPSPQALIKNCSQSFIFRTWWLLSLFSCSFWVPWTK